MRRTALALVLCALSSVAFAQERAIVLRAARMFDGREIAFARRHHRPGRGH